MRLIVLAAILSSACSGSDAPPIEPDNGTKKNTPSDRTASTWIPDGSSTEDDACACDDAGAGDPDPDPVDANQTGMMDANPTGALDASHQGGIDAGAPNANDAGKKGKGKDKNKDKNDDDNEQ
jgi:hypothetical protein